jgi:MOSC domain-containing protein YiiM
MTAEQPGRVEHIHIAEVESGPVRALTSVEATAGVGLAGDRYAKGKGFWPDDGESRDLTLIEGEAIDDLAGLGITLEPGESRRNITTRGIRLNELVGKEFTIGEVRARGTDLCEPCMHLVALTGKPLIKPLVHRAGLRADLLTSGRISVGDAIVPVPAADPLPTAPG